MMKPCPWPIDALLPHAPPMILLDAVTGHKEGALEAEVTIRKDAPFFRDGGMPAHVAIEYMAQACGALVGIEAREAGRIPRVGYLLGTRDFRAVRDRVSECTRLTVTVQTVLRDDNMGVFDCQVMNGESRELFASARLTVYQPNGAPTGGQGRND